MTVDLRSSTNSDWLQPRVQIRRLAGTIRINSQAINLEGKSSKLPASLELFGFGRIQTIQSLAQLLAPRKRLATVLLLHSPEAL
jgi:hypothetical protein